MSRMGRGGMRGMMRQMQGALGNMGGGFRPPG